VTRDIIIMPVIIGAAGTISNSFSKYLSNIPGHMKLYDISVKLQLG
jgi:hypothetical protein